MKAAKTRSIESGRVTAIKRQCKSTVNQGEVRALAGEMVQSHGPLPDDMDVTAEALFRPKPAQPFPSRGTRCQVALAHGVHFYNVCEPLDLLSVKFVAERVNTVTHAPDENLIVWACSCEQAALLATAVAHDAPHDMLCSLCHICALCEKQDHQERRALFAEGACARSAHTDDYASAARTLPKHLVMPNLVARILLTTTTRRRRPCALQCADSALSRVRCFSRSNPLAVWPGGASLT